MLRDDQVDVIVHLTAFQLFESRSICIDKLSDILQAKEYAPPTRTAPHHGKN